MVIKFSERVTGIDLSGIRKIFEAAGPGSINLGLGQPDFDTPQHIKDATTGCRNCVPPSAGNSKMRTASSITRTSCWSRPAQARRSIS